MPSDSQTFFQEALSIWSSGGWLMIPLLALTIYIYFTALELLFLLGSHYLIRSGVHRMSDSEIATCSRGDWTIIRRLLVEDAANADEVKRHFEEVRNDYLPLVNRRIRFLGVLIAVGPLMGLLGTVTGMLSTFSGMVQSQSSRFDSVVQGISEALITTQTGLVISIPAFLILTLIAQRRNVLQHCIARLERYNTCLALKVGCPIPVNREAKMRNLLAAT